MADDRREFSLLTEWLQTLPDFHFHNPQPQANSFTVPMERGAVENGWEGGAGLQACLGTRFLPLTCFWPKGKKKKRKPTHSPFSLPRQMWGPGRHSSVEMVSRKPLQNLFLGVGVRVCNYICLAEVSQGLCNSQWGTLTLCCYLEAGYESISTEPPPEVSCAENLGFNRRSQLCGESGGSDQFSKMDLVDEHFHCRVKVMRGVWLGCVVPQSVWVEWLLRWEGRNLGWFVFATPSTWSVASTTLTTTITTTNSMSLSSQFGSHNLISSGPSIAFLLFNEPVS